MSSCWILYYLLKSWSICFYVSSPQTSFRRSFIQMFCLFVPQLYVWDFRIYEITGQVKGHSWEVKWEAKICKTKEMTGQCQMKGQKSSDRLRLDESKRFVCWASEHSEVSQYSCIRSQRRLTLRFTINNHVPLVIRQVYAINL